MMMAAETLASLGAMYGYRINTASLDTATLAALVDLLEPRTLGSSSSASSPSLSTRMLTSPNSSDSLSPFLSSSNSPIDSPPPLLPPPTYLPDGEPLSSIAAAASRQTTNVASFRVLGVKPPKSPLRSHRRSSGPSSSLGHGDTPHITLVDSSIGGSVPVVTSNTMTNPQSSLVTASPNPTSMTLPSTDAITSSPLIAPSGQSLIHRSPLPLPPSLNLLGVNVSPTPPDGSSHPHDHPPLSRPQSIQLAPLLVPSDDHSPLLHPSLQTATTGDTGGASTVTSGPGTAPGLHLRLPSVRSPVATTAAYNTGTESEDFLLEGLDQPRTSPRPVEIHDDDDVDETSRALEAMEYKQLKKMEAGAVMTQNLISLQFARRNSLRSDTLSTAGDAQPRRQSLVSHDTQSQHSQASHPSNASSHDSHAHHHDAEDPDEAADVVHGDALSPGLPTTGLRGHTRRSSGRRNERGGSTNAGIGTTGSHLPNARSPLGTNTTPSTTLLPPANASSSSTSSSLLPPASSSSSSLLSSSSSSSSANPLGVSGPVNKDMRGPVSYRANPYDLHLENIKMKATLQLTVPRLPIAMSTATSSYMAPSTADDATSSGRTMLSSRHFSHLAVPPQRQPSYAYGPASPGIHVSGVDNSGTGGTSSNGQHGTGGTQDDVDRVAVVERVGFGGKRSVSHMIVGGGSVAPTFIAAIPAGPTSGNTGNESSMVATMVAQHIPSYSETEWIWCWRCCYSDEVLRKFDRSRQDDPIRSLYERPGIQDKRKTEDKPARCVAWPGSAQGPGVWVTLFMLFELCQWAFLPLEYYSPRWAKDSHRAVLLIFNSTFMGWFSFGAVCALIFLLALQFVLDIRQYVIDSRDPKRKPMARHKLFVSLAGSFIYNHIRVDRLNRTIRRLLFFLCDTAFLTITFHLLNSLSCTRYGLPSSLDLDVSVTCWPERSLFNSALLLIALQFYLIIVVMLAPNLVLAGVLQRYEARNKLFKEQMEQVLQRLSSGSGEEGAGALLDQGLRLNDQRNRQASRIVGVTFHHKFLMIQYAIKSILLTGYVNILREYRYGGLWLMFGYIALSLFTMIWINYPNIMVRRRKPKYSNTHNTNATNNNPAMSTSSLRSTPMTPTAHSGHTDRDRGDSRATSEDNITRELQASIESLVYATAAMSQQFMPSSVRLIDYYKILTFLIGAWSALTVVSFGPGDPDGWTAAWSIGIAAIATTTIVMYLRRYWWGCRSDTLISRICCCCSKYRRRNHESISPSGSEGSSIMLTTLSSPIVAPTSSALSGDTRRVEQLPPQELNIWFKKNKVAIAKMEQSVDDALQGIGKAIAKHQADVMKQTHASQALQAVHAQDHTQPLTQIVVTDSSGVESTPYPANLSTSPSPSTNVIPTTPATTSAAETTETTEITNTSTALPAPSLPSLPPSTSYDVSSGLPPRSDLSSASFAPSEIQDTSSQQGSEASSQASSRSGEPDEPLGTTIHPTSAVALVTEHGAIPGFDYGMKESNFFVACPGATIAPAVPLDNETTSRPVPNNTSISPDLRPRAPPGASPRIESTIATNPQDKVTGPPPSQKTTHASPRTLALAGPLPSITEGKPTPDAALALPPVHHNLETKTNNVMSSTRIPQPSALDAVLNQRPEDYCCEWCERDHAYQRHRGLLIDLQFTPQEFIT